MHTEDSSISKRSSQYPRETDYPFTGDGVQISLSGQFVFEHYDICLFRRRPQRSMSKSTTARAAGIASRLTVMEQQRRGSFNLEQAGYAHETTGVGDHEGHIRHCEGYGKRTWEINLLDSFGYRSCVA